MPRLPAKTYGRSQAASVSSRAFDDIMRDNTTPSASQTASTMHRWGKTSFTSKRNNPEVDNRKRKVEDEVIEVDSPTDTELFGDPFSFDSDDDGPSKPKKGMGFKGNKGAATKNAAVKTASSKPLKPTLTRKTDPVIAKPLKPTLTRKPDLMEVRSIDRAAISKTYTQIGKAAMAKSSSAALPNRNASDGKIHLTLDKFTLKVSSQQTGGAVLTNSGTVVSGKNGTDQWDALLESSNKSRKFFTSSSQQNSTGSIDDHNYSQSSVLTVHSSGSDGEGEDGGMWEGEEEDDYPPSDHNYSSPRRVPSPPRTTHDPHPIKPPNFSEVLVESTARKASPGIWESDCDSDWDKESGDPEIIFNSPRKKRLHQESRFQKLVSDSPITVDSASEDNTDANSVCSNSSAARLSLTKQALNSIKTSRVSHVKEKGCDGLSTSQHSSGSSQGEGREKRRLLLKERDGRDRKKREEPLIRRLLTSPKKSEHKLKASYNPRQWHDPDEDDPGQEVMSQQPGSLSRSDTAPNSKRSVFSSFDDEDLVVPPNKLRSKTLLRKSNTDPSRPWQGEVTTLKVDRDHKPLFTVVRNVKQAHECLEHGETQEFQDELEYILPGLRDTQPVATRCLSSVSLATKCTAHAFRMHLRAHGDLTKIFCFLHDAPKHPATLGLCAATLMFMNSRDRLHMDLERSDLTLMLQLLDCEITTFDNGTEADKVRRKLEAIIEQFRSEGNVKDFVLEDISVGKLAMETLLSLTSRRAGDWLKEELRTLGGLDHIINTVRRCGDSMDEVTIDPSQAMLNGCRKVDRCLRVLENVTYLNGENQMYLIAYKSSMLIKSLHHIMRVCCNVLPFHRVKMVDAKVDKSSVGYVTMSCLLAAFRTLLNVTHENRVGATKLGQLDGFIPLLLSCILNIPQYIATDERFDLYVLGIGLTINLVEDCDHNRRLLLSSTASTPHEHMIQHSVEAIEALTMLFIKRYEAARRIEEEHDAKLEDRERRRDELTSPSQRAPGNNLLPRHSAHNRDSQNESGVWKESDSGLEWVMNPVANEGEGETQTDDSLEVVPGSQEEDENFTEALHKAGKHMEDSIVAAYVALLVGCLLQYNSELAETVRLTLPESSFVCMIRMLKKFLGFMNFTSGTVGNTGGKSIMRVIELLQSCDA